MISLEEDIFGKEIEIVDRWVKISKGKSNFQSLDLDYKEIIEFCEGTQTRRSSACEDTLKIALISTNRASH